MDFEINENLDLSNDSHILELSHFQFPSVTIDKLTKEPYLSYVKLYKEMYSDLKFYRGFKNPDAIMRAKIYRALDLCCVDRFLINNIIVFTTTEGLIIKCRYSDDETFSQRFNYYMSQEDHYVFIPEKCDKLDQYNYSYYRRMLNNFIANERIPGKTLRLNEHDNVFLFISLEKSFIEDNINETGICGNGALERRWKEYLQGGVFRTYTFPSDRLITILKIFSWMSRIRFKILSNDKIQITVRSPSMKDFENKLRLIENNSPIETNYIDIGFTIADEYEAFGILRVIRKEIQDGSMIIPLVGTSRIYSTTLDDIKKILNKYEYTEEIPEGNEVFTQDEFSGMSKWRMASLIKAPSGNFYSIMDLYRNLKKEDPLTREPFSEEFKNKIYYIMNEIDGVFITGFPPTDFEPELITIASEPDATIRTISFYIKIGEETNAFWIIPDLRDTEFSKITLDAIRTLVIKWSDHSLFKNSFPNNNIIPDGDIHLVFSPIALFVFEQTISNLTIENYPRMVKDQAEHLRNQVYLLKRCS